MVDLAPGEHTQTKTTRHGGLASNSVPKSNLTVLIAVLQVLLSAEGGQGSKLDCCCSICLSVDRLCRECVRQRSPFRSYKPAEHKAAVRLASPASKRSAIGQTAAFAHGRRATAEAASVSGAAGGSAATAAMAAGRPIEVAHNRKGVCQKDLHKLLATCALRTLLHGYLKGA
jgi:hypothetical protein